MTESARVWVRLCALEDIPSGKATNVFINGQRYVIARDGDLAAVLQGFCSHMLYPFKDAQVADCTITCDLHGSQFDIRDGSVLNWPMPMLPDTQERKRLKTFETRVEAGILYVAWPAADPSRVRVRF
jgi:nitrite reductase/ring-hydroxylating ferredoxin subunit